MTHGSAPDATIGLQMNRDTVRCAGALWEIEVGLAHPMLVARNAARIRRASGVREKVDMPADGYLSWGWLKSNSVRGWINDTAREREREARRSFLNPSSQQLAAAGDAEVGIEPLHVVVNGVKAKAELAGDLFLAIARQEILERFLWTAGEAPYFR